jgi:tripartite-type tricarboxylate transporter receptor subunit TctC
MLKEGKMKKAFLLSLIGSLGFVFFGPAASTWSAETYPSQPIQLIVPMAPGDTVDLAGRAIGTELAKIVKTPVVVNNKPGGGSTVGADFVAKGKKDGYTLLFANSNIYYAHAMNPEEVPYNPLTDLEPLCLSISTPLTIVVNADAPWKTFQELIDYMKKNPGKIRGSSSGVGSVGHFNFEVIGNETGAPITMIPYKGASPAMTALMGGHVEVSTLSLSLIYPQLQAGKLRALLTSKKVSEFPNVPTLKQLGYKTDISSVLFAFYGPAGLSDSVKKSLASPLEKATKAPDVVKAMQQLGAVEDYVPGAEFKKMMTEEYGMVQKLLKGKGGATAK